MNELVVGLICFVFVILLCYLLSGSKTESCSVAKAKPVVTQTQLSPPDSWDIIFHSKADKSGSRQYYTTVGNAPQKVQDGYSKVKIEHAKTERGERIPPDQYSILFLGKQYAEGSEMTLSGIKPFSFLASDPRLYYKGDGKVTVTFSFI